MKMQREAREDRKVRENKINRDWKYTEISSLIIIWTATNNEKETQK